jgi:hypothetical protein
MPTPTEEYREIPLTKAQVAKVSPHRFEDLTRWKWQAVWNKDTRSFYAVRHASIEGRSQAVYMHRQILGLSLGDPQTGDHEDHDTLNNTDGNVRPANKSQQQHNRRKDRRNKSGHKGVSWDKSRGKWTAHISAHKKQKNLGRFDSIKDAVLVYRAAQSELHGEFACLE